MKPKTIHVCLGLIILAAAYACSPSASTVSVPAELQPALTAITTDGLMEPIRVLSVDEFEGRGPGTPGEEKSVAYIQEQFRGLGLKPGNPDGTFLQDVPLIGFLDTPTASITTGAAGDQVLPLKYSFEFMANSHRYDPEVKVDNSGLVFVGYGVVAPEYGWDDYKGVEVRGKTLVMLVGDPPVPDPADPSKLDEKMFKGKAMTYYGRWTYKFEIASEKGAAAAIVVHDTAAAGYPFNVVSGGWAQEQFDIVRKDRNTGHVAVEAWITTDGAQRIFEAAHQDFAALKASAVHKDFRPVALDATASFDVKHEVRQINSKNVIAKLEGSDPQLKNEYVIYSAHWDHLGKNDQVTPPAIFHGALDNASGIAALLESAKAFTKIQPAPRRSILFMATTAEEKGLLGAKYYVENPLYPLTKTVANINYDGLNPWGETTDFVVVGLGQTTLEDALSELAAGHQRTIKPDPQPEKGGFYRNDEFEFAKQGVPTIHSSSGTDYIGRPAGWGLQKRDEYVANEYHKPSDMIKPDWDMSGAVADVRLLLELGYKVAQSDSLPQWKEGAEFKAKRDTMMQAGGGVGN
jgi:Zn-dependent M28 family amino/carboxypeptidase